MTMPLYKTKRRHFPDPQTAFEDGLVAFGDEINKDLLLEAYSFGIFPWPHEAFPVLWFSPLDRGVLKFSELHISRSLKKFIKQTDLKVTFNKDFKSVIEACSKVPRKEGGTWITPMLKRAYIDFHKAGYAHSVECWKGEELVGGMYGVYVAGVFSGESMFYKKDNASKLCLVKLIEKLQQNGLTWMDIQMVTPNLEAFGGKYISQADFLEKLGKAKVKAKKITL